MLRRFTSSLQRRLALNFVTMAILLSGVISLAFYISALQQLRQNTMQRLTDIVSTAVLQVDVDAHATLTDPSQMWNPTYQDLFNTLYQINEAIPDLTFVYTERMVDGKIYFVVDGAVEDQSLLGDLYPDAPAILYDIANNLDAPVVDPEIYTDSFGSWITAYAPLYTSDGRQDGVLAIDLAADKYIAAQRRLALIAIALFIAAAPLATLTGWYIGRRLSKPIVELTQATTNIAEGKFSDRINPSTGDEIQTLAENFNTMAASLDQVITNLETDVQARTEMLARRTSYLEASAQVASVATSLLDTDLLIRDVVDLIRERFELYYVGLFLIDEAKEWAVLKAGTGTAGQAMLTRGHAIKIGYGMIGWCIANAQARIAEIADQDQVRLVTAELPDTRSEAAIPLRSRGQVIGALTVQSDQPNAFDESLLYVLQTMADQVAIALDNSRLFAERQQSIETLQRSFNVASQEAWSQILRARKISGYRYDRSGLTPLRAGTGVKSVQLLTGFTLNNQSPGDAGQERQQTQSFPELNLPITVRGQVIGRLQARKPQNSGGWQHAEVTLIQNLVNQLDAALDGAQLFQETRRRAERERLAGEITSRLRASNNPQDILQTVVAELRQALQAQQAQVTLVSPESANTSRVRVSGEADPANTDAAASYLASLHRSTDLPHGEPEAGGSKSGESSSPGDNGHATE